MIKLIKNLKQGEDVEMVKGCNPDYCTAVDRSTCNYVDVCKEDYSGCPIVDYCYVVDLSNSCTASSDICDYDY